jgi:gliding motility-associated protein GldM
MALPAEPRQKMINIMYLVLTALLALNVSSEILKAFKVVDGSLKRSNSNLQVTNDQIYASFAEAKKDAKTAAKAALLEPDALEIKQASSDLAKIIDKYRVAIKEEAGKPNEQQIKEGSEVNKEDNLEIGASVMDTKNGGVEVFNAIAAYKEKVKAILNKQKEGTVSGYDFVFAKGTPLDDVTIKDGKQLAKSNFYMQPVVANLTMLSKTLNDLKNTEADAISYLYGKVGGVVIRYNQFSVMGGTSSTYLMPNEEMVVTAGLGAFSDQGKPSITINGVNAPPNSEGIGEYKFKVTQSGSVKINISFTDPNTGQPQTRTKEINYTVGQPSGASVSADKMNVFYIGVDNPITIGSGKGWDKTNVSMEGGTISGSGGSRSVRVSSPGNAFVVVTMDGESPKKFPFRVKYLPPAAAGIGPNLQQDGVMPAASFRAMGGIRAALVGSEFDATYTVVSYTIIGSGPGFSPTAFGTNTGGFWSGAAAAVANRAVPGSMMVFSNIVVKGPDGREVKASNSTVAIRCT